VEVLLYTILILALDGSEFMRGMAGKTRRDKIRNTHIRGELKMKEIQNQTERSRLRWYEDVKKIEEHRIPKKDYWK
jgi:hypothetical protein